MLRYVIKREILYNLSGLGFQITSLLTVTVFVIGSLTFLKSYNLKMQEYSKYQNESIEQLRKSAQRSATEVAMNRQTLILKPRKNSFIADAKETFFPNKFIFNAFGISGFEREKSSINPLLDTFLELNWSFIIVMIVSFSVFLLTYDAISGEKESGILAITLSNAVRRGTLLSGKYISTVITTMAMVVIGTLSGLVVILGFGRFTVSFPLLIEVLGFIVSAFVFVSCITVCGLFASVITHRSNVSLLLTVTFWLLFVVAIPSTTLFWTKQFLSIESTETINEQIRLVQEDIENNSPREALGRDQKLRAAMYNDMFESEQKIKSTHFRNMFRQFERARLLSSLSPVTLFESINEALVGGGYARFQKVWNDLHLFQPQFLQFFRDVDAADPESPHLLNPNIFYLTTKKPVNFEKIPIFKEGNLSFRERIGQTGPYILLLVIYTVVVFFLTFILFMRYDVR